MFTRREKREANRLVERAIKAGKIKKKPCQVCKNKDSVAHHEDYNNPFDIIWLCRQHHTDIHSKNIERFTRVYKKIFKTKTGFLVREDKYEIIKDYENRIMFGLQKAKKLTEILCEKLEVA